MRLSYSRWHQKNVPPGNVLNAARGCLAAGLDYFISFVTDFSAQDDPYEHYLRNNALKFFPEPLIYSGRADTLEPKAIRTDYQENRCAMNPYLAPDLSLYACCDAGSHFIGTDFFLLGNLRDHSIQQLFTKSETDPLYACIRSMGITAIASFAGIPAREIVTYRKCELCKKLFDTPETLKTLRKAAKSSNLQRWTR